MPTEQLRSNPGVSPRPRGEERRLSILRIAVELFSAGGYNTVSLADIARQVGISQAGILHYYPTKAALLLAVLQQRDDENGLLLAAQEKAGIAGLEAYVGMLAENDLRPELVRLFVVLRAESTAVEHPAHSWFMQRNGKTMPIVTQDVRDIVDESKLPPGVTAEVISRWLLALAHGLGAQWVTDPSSFDRAGHVRLFIDLLGPYLKEPASHSSTTTHTTPRR
ncbi:helix-turn-helix domain-containing protein [Microbacterium marmarense]|uniref:Helix-turn-helix domain-containing protein n=1 Tax=Microbacterium marmarense TaxID=3122051 RepID=A0ABU8LRC7_9MICO